MSIPVDILELFGLKSSFDRYHLLENLEHCLRHSVCEYCASLTLKELLILRSHFDGFSETSPLR